MKRPGYRDAVEYIACNDSPGDGPNEEAIHGYVSTHMLASLFDVDQDRVARDVARCRTRNGIKPEA